VAAASESWAAGSGSIVTELLKQGRSTEMQLPSPPGCRDFSYSKQPGEVAHSSR
jgi:hypothetical protein